VVLSLLLAYAKQSDSRAL